MMTNAWKQELQLPGVTRHFLSGAVVDVHVVLSPCLPTSGHHRYMQGRSAHFSQRIGNEIICAQRCQAR